MFNHYNLNFCRIVNQKHHKSTIITPVYGPVHRVSAAESQVSSNFVKPHIGDNTVNVQNQKGYLNFTN